MTRSATARTVAVLIVTLAVLVAGCGSGSDEGSASSSTSRSTSSSTTTTTTPRPADLPLYPFANLQEVGDWQQTYGSTGSQPERLDAGLTAVAFARFLGYTEIDQVVSSREDAQGAHVAVGFRNSDSGNLTTAAVVRLVRYGNGSHVPWEVVGTDDTDLRFTAPAYGATVTSPLAVAGRISGVDESITVHVQQLHSNGFARRALLHSGRWHGSALVGHRLLLRPH